MVTSAMLRTWPVRLRGHRVDVVGEVFPGAGHARHLRLAAELAFGAHLAGHAGDFRGEGVELVDHRVDGVLSTRRISPFTSAVILRESRRGRWRL